MVILEEFEHARRRGATIYGEVRRLRHDRRRVSDHRHPARWPRGDRRDADGHRGRRLNPSDIGYVNAHGTSTTVNDKVETLACKEVFGAHAPQGAGQQHQEHDGPPDRRRRRDRNDRLLAGDARFGPAADDQLRTTPTRLCDLDYVPNEAREAEIAYALNNTFGFGGQNVTLCLARDVQDLQ